jgi:hypothetical protein
MSQPSEGTPDRIPRNVIRTAAYHPLCTVHGERMTRDGANEETVYYSCKKPGCGRRQSVPIVDFVPLSAVTANGLRPSR